MEKHKATPWVDKYRPKKLDDIIQQEEVIKLLKDTLTTGDLPHLLFYGPPGTGKTTSILAISKELFGPIKSSERIIELNASDERGIGVVRNKIITFAKMAIGSADPNYPCPPFKIVILDEADAMTTEAQTALRKIMEDESKITRFCFLCNYINQIIEPIASRCMKFRFLPISNKLMNEKLKYIANKENIDISEEIINTISEISNGDVRRGIITLHNLKYIYKFKNILTIQDVYETANLIPKIYIDTIYNLCLTHKPFNEIISETEKLKREGYPINNFIEQFKNKIIYNTDISDIKKSLILIQLGITERRLIEGADEYIQLLNIIVYANGIVTDKINFIPESIM